MKMTSIIVAGLGVLALVLGVVGWLIQVPILRVRMGGYIHGAIALYLLALVIMVFDHNYCRRSGTTPAAKS
jgi:hypothetical protein